MHAENGEGFCKSGFTACLGVSGKCEPVLPLRKALYSKTAKKNMAYISILVLYTSAAYTVWLKLDYSLFAFCTVLNWVHLATVYISRDMEVFDLAEGTWQQQVEEQR